MLANPDVETRRDEDHGRSRQARAHELDGPARRAGDETELAGTVRPDALAREPLVDVVRERGRRVVAIARQLLASLRDDPREHRFVDLERGDVVLEQLGVDRAGALADPGDLARGDLEQHDAEREDVRATVDVAAEHLLGRHVGRRPERRAGASQLAHVVEELGEPEVRHLGGALVRDDHVGGFEVAVEHALLVRVADRERDVAEDLHPAAQGESLARQERRERLADDELHGVVGQVAREPGVGDPHDVGVLETRGRLGLADEAFDESGPPGLAQDLEGDQLAGGLAPRLEDDPHAASADLLEERVGAELGSRDHERSSRARARARRREPERRERRGAERLVLGVVQGVVALDLVVDLVAVLVEARGRLEVEGVARRAGVGGHERDLVGGDERQLVRDLRDPPRVAAGRQDHGLVRARRKRAGRPRRRDRPRRGSGRDATRGRARARERLGGGGRQLARSHEDHGEREQLARSGAASLLALRPFERQGPSAAPQRRPRAPGAGPPRRSPPAGPASP